MSGYDPEKFNELLLTLAEKSYVHVCSLDCEAWVTEEPLPFERKTEGRRIDFELGMKWAEEVFDCAWFHVTGTLPEGTDTQRVVFRADCGGEGLIYDKNGVEKQGITSIGSDFDRSKGVPGKRVILNRGLTDGLNVDFWIDGAANDLFGNMQNDSKFVLLEAAYPDEETRALYYDAEVLGCLAEAQKDDKNTAFADIVRQALSALPAAEDFDPADSARYRSVLAPLLNEKNPAGDVFEITATGHAHLDLAWLWPLRESYRKAARTFTNQIMNIERYPEYVFGASQAQLYTWVRDKYPRVWAKVKELADGPNWELQGATWVEPDSNLISGESLIRQFYYGKKFYNEEFGRDMKIFWVPDSFGYSACIPQVMKLAGVPYFLTQKISWNTVTRFPYHTFHWEGLDGSKVFAHMLPEDTYNGSMLPEGIMHTESNYSERAISSKSGMCYGIGDGGAGPGFEHIERLRRFRDLKTIPKVKPGKMLDLFRELDDGKTEYPTHRGELYLERHQGTYTTRSKNKKMNRRCEILLRNYEYMLTAAEKAGVAPPLSAADLDEIWKEVLLYQFHDILPGSSINRVYAETSARYDEITDRLEHGIAELIGKLSAGDTMFNFAPYSYSATFKDAGVWKKLHLHSMSGTKVADAKAIEDFSALAEPNAIENYDCRIEFRDGAITSYYDKKHGRELVKAGERMNVFSVYRDEGDCWDIRPVEYQGTKQDARCVLFETGTDGPTAFANISWQIGGTYIKEKVTITDGEPSAVFDIDMDVRQSKSMLRVAFPTTVNADEAKFNIQFGHIARSTKEDTPAHTAQYEVSAQKFVDLSAGGFGVSLLNDCKYGYRMKGSTIDVDLVRSPKGGPGKEVDQGPQSVKLVLFPHSGELSFETYRAAYALNMPPVRINGSAETDRTPEYTTNNEKIVLESVKLADDGSGMIARFYNSSEQPQKAFASFAGYSPKCTVDIPENETGAFGGELDLKPFELVLVKYC
ncbi:MAG: hypothetical protein K6G71_04695 [Clostridiales bacterium]|nr:hypothetical protein [Clostridiales bacterium]